MKFTRIFQIPQISLSIALLCGPFLLLSCRESEPTKAAQAQKESIAKASPLETEIAKIIREETYDEDRLKSLLMGKTWEEVAPVLSAAEATVQETDGQKPEKIAVARALSKIRSALSQNRKKGLLQQMTHDLQEMADKEGLSSQ